MIASEIATELLLVIAKSIVDANETKLYNVNLGRTDVDAVSTCLSKMMECGWQVSVEDLHGIAFSEYEQIEELECLPGFHCLVDTLKAIFPGKYYYEIKNKV